MLEGLTTSVIFFIICASGTAWLLYGGQDWKKATGIAGGFFLLLGKTMTKPFKSIDEQVEILRSRGLAVKEEDKKVLLAEGYYNVINGYKDLFETHKNSNRFKEGVSFSDIYGVFLFDRSLRELTFHYILRAEARIKTVSVYTFCETFPEEKSYLNKDNYTSVQDYPFNQKQLEDDLERYISMLSKRAYTNKYCKPYIAHYRDKYDYVPLWVLAKTFTFGDISLMFNLQKRSVQNKICKRVGLLAENKAGKPLMPHEMRIIIRTLVAFRNICAHDERLLSARVGKHKDAGFYDMIKMLARVLPQDEVDELICKIKDKAFAREMSNEILDKLGFD